MTALVTIKGIRLHNWRCFRGEHELDLEPTVYSITAEADTDPERSNWLGKSSFLEAIVFALTGSLRTGEKVDDWITDGEAEGGVDLELSDGTLINRFRERGKSTKLIVEWDDEKARAVLAGTDAQTHIDEEYIDEATLMKTSYFGQKKVDQFITMAPSKRTQIVNDWLELDTLVEAEEIGRFELRDLTKTEEQLHRKMQYSDGKESLEHLETMANDAATNLQESHDRLASSSDTRSALQAWNRSKQAHDHYITTKKAADRAPQTDLPDVELSRKLATQAEFVWQTACTERNAAAKVAKGKFDGACPVAEFNCPAVTKINAQGETNRRTLAILKRGVESSAKTKRLTAETDYDTRCKLHEIEKYNDAIAAAKKQLSRLREDYDFIQNNPKPPENLNNREEKEAYEESVRVHTRAVQAVKQERERLSLFERLGKEIAELLVKMTLCRQGIAVLKKSRRFISEEALALMERDANLAMSDSDIDLQVGVSWESELNKLADSCDECGNSFPPSQRVKTCPQCGATRPKGAKQEMSIELSDESGGAGDLAGFWFQLAASVWLSRQYSIAWSVGLIDEVFGALDRKHTRALAQHLATTLTTRFGMAQAFVVAHDVSALESLPARIVITSDGSNSKVTVSG